MTPFEAYIFCSGIKAHFNNKFDFILYNGKIQLSYDSFERRNDKSFYAKLAKRKDLKEFLIANYTTKGPNVWVGELVNSSDAEKIFVEWKKRTQALSYYFEEDLKKCLTLLEDNLIVKEHQHPYLLKMYYRKKISLETLVILNDLLGFFKHWNKQLSEDPLWVDTYRLCVQYKPFLIYDTKRMKSIAYDVFEERHSEVA